MALEEGGVDEEEGLVVGEGDGGGPEVPHVPGVDEEGTSRRVHGCQHLGVDDIFKGQFSNIVPMFIVSMLSKKCNGTLSIIDVKLGHVEIIDEINKFLLALRTELLSSNFLQKLFELDLQIGGIGVIGEVDKLVVEAIGVVFDDGSEAAFGDGCFTSSCQSDQQNWVVDEDEFLYEVFCGHAFFGGD